MQNRGYAFVEVKPRISRDKEKHTVDLVFDVGEGPRVYVERIEIDGNTAHRGQGDPPRVPPGRGRRLQRRAIRRTRQRIAGSRLLQQRAISSPRPARRPTRRCSPPTVEEKATGELSLGGGYSTDAGFAGQRRVCASATCSAPASTRSINGVLAQRNSSIDLSVTDPYFLDRNLVAGVDLFYVTRPTTGHLASTARGAPASRCGSATSSTSICARPGTTRWSIATSSTSPANASLYISEQAGNTLLSQIGQTLTLDYRDSTVDPHTRLRRSGFGTDFAGLGGDAHFVRDQAGRHATTFRWIATPETRDWGIAVSGGVGYLFNLGVQEQIIDRFFLGGDNLRGFQTGGAGPHDPVTGDSLGGRFIWTQSTELRFPLPMSADIGLSGRAFVDVGGADVRRASNREMYRRVSAPALASDNTCPPIFDNGLPRVGAGVGVSWRTPFGLINIDVTPFVVKYKFDQTQVFRFGFGTRF